MKVKPWNKKIVSLLLSTMSGVFGIQSFIYIFIDFSKHQKIKVAVIIINIFLLISLYIGLLIYANKKKTRKMRINNNTVNITFGNLFQNTDGLYVINFNEYLDTQVNDKIILPSSLNGQILLNHKDEISAIDNEIINSSDCIVNIIGENKRRVEGKKIKYRLGTCFRYNDFIGMAFSRFDDNNHAFLEAEDYLYCLSYGWKQINYVYNNKNLYIPLMGTGITRGSFFSHTPKQKLLQLMIDTLRISNVKFSSTITINFVISDEFFNEISLYDLK